MLNTGGCARLGVLKCGAVDDATDTLHGNLFSVLLEHQWSFPAATGVDATLLGRYDERFADHAVEVGRRVIFQTTGSTGHAN